MSDTTTPASATQALSLTTAEQARAGLLRLMCVAPLQGRDELARNASVAAQQGISPEAFKALLTKTLKEPMSVIRTEMRQGAKLFSHRTHTVEIDESVEALLHRGNVALLRRDLQCAYNSYVAALNKAAERA